MIIALFGRLVAAAAITESSAITVDRPLQLEVDADQDGVRLSVVALSSTTCEASYELEVISGASGNGNFSTQRGRARLHPGIAVTVARITMDSSGSWAARLRVEPCRGLPYEQQRSSSD